MGKGHTFEIFVTQRKGRPSCHLVNGEALNTSESRPACPLPATFSPQRTGFNPKWMAPIAIATAEYVISIARTAAAAPAPAHRGSLERARDPWSAALLV